MKIEGSDYIITYSSGNFFDLELSYTVKSKNGDTREEYKVSGYGMPLEACIKRIINYRINKKYETLTLKEYLQEYNRLLVDLKQTIENEQGL